MLSARTSISTLCLGTGSRCRMERRSDPDPIDTAPCRQNGMIFTTNLFTIMTGVTVILAKAFGTASRALQDLEHRRIHACLEHF